MNEAILYMFLLIAAGMYCLGSWNTFRKKNAVLVDYGFGIFFDLLTVALMVFGFADTTEVPRGGMFHTHIVLAGLGLLGFITIFVTILILGDKDPHPRIGKLALFIVLPVWLIGAGLGIANALL